MSRTATLIVIKPDVRSCAKCSVEKPIDQFYKQTKDKYGTDSYCKPCRKLVNKSYVAEGVYKSAEHKAKAVIRTQEHNMRKYGTTYKPSPKKIAQLQGKYYAEL